MNVVKGGFLISDARFRRRVQIQVRVMEETNR